MKDAKGHGSDGRGAKRGNTRGALPAHQSSVDKLMRVGQQFLKSESGQGKIPPFIEENKSHDPEQAGRFIGEMAHKVHEGIVPLSDIPATLLHLAHFLGFLGAVAVADVLVQGVASVLGHPI